MKEVVCDRVRKSNACHCNHRNCYRSAHLPNKIGLIYFFFQFCNQFFFDWIIFFTCFIWYCLKCLIFSKQLFFKSKSCVPTELFSASGKSFSKNSELKLFMRFWKFSSDFKVEFQASNVEECKKIQNQFENGSLKADEFLAVVDISFKTVASQMEKYTALFPATTIYQWQTKL